MAQQVTVFTSAEDGYISNNPTIQVFKTQDSIKTTAFDSTAILTEQGYWFFDTSDANTGLPPSAKITRVEFAYYVSASTLPQDSTNEVWWSDLGIWGTTLDASDYHDTTGFDTERHVHPFFLPILGWNYQDLQTLGTIDWFINRNGTTNVRMLVTSSSGYPATLTMDSKEKAGGNPAFLRITFETVKVTGVTTYNLQGVNREDIRDAEENMDPDLRFKAVYRQRRRGTE